MAGRNSNNTGWGNLTHLKPVNDTSTITTNKVPKPTRTIKISEQLFRRLAAHSKKYYNVESYDFILSTLLDEFDKNHTPDYSYQHLTKY
ncbi:MAG: hypothetical protein ACRD8K_06850 [Nitrososphaeraceae archaeon]